MSTKKNKIVIETLENEFEDRLTTVDTQIISIINAKKDLKRKKEYLEESKDDLFVLANAIDKINGNSDYNKKIIEATDMDAVEVAQRRIKEKEDISYMKDDDNIPF